MLSKQISGVGTWPATAEGSGLVVGSWWLVGSASGWLPSDIAKWPSHVLSLHQPRTNQPPTNSRPRPTIAQIMRMPLEQLRQFRLPFQ